MDITKSLNSKFPMFMDDWSHGHVTRHKFDKDNTPIKQMALDFRINEKELEDINILIATYTYEDYSGSAFVLYEKDGKLYEVNGGHCSCYGLEDQWCPEEVSIEVLEHRLTVGTMGKISDWDWINDTETYINIFADELLELLQVLKQTLK